MKPEQLAHVKRQLEGHQHDDYTVDLVMDETLTLKAFEVHAGVMRPEMMTTLHFARWLYQHKELYSGKTTLDLGSGSGLQGVVMALAGAKRTLFSDVSEAAVKNTQTNVQRYGLQEKTAVYHGNLFEKIDEPVDLIVFNHPFFSTEEHPFFDDPLVRKLSVSRSMVSQEDLIHRFLVDARKYFREGICIVMPFYHFAGEANNPLTQGRKHGYHVGEVYKQEVGVGFQKGTFSVYLLR